MKQLMYSVFVIILSILFSKSVYADPHNYMEASIKKTQCDNARAQANLQYYGSPPNYYGIEYKRDTYSYAKTQADIRQPPVYKTEGSHYWNGLQDNTLAEGQVNTGDTNFYNANSLEIEGDTAFNSGNYTLAYNKYEAARISFSSSYDNYVSAHSYFNSAITHMWDAVNEP